MTRGIVHHVDLTVANPKASKPFYVAVLGFMGYVIESERDEIIDFRLDAPDGSHPCFIGITRAERTTTHDRYAPGLHHIAWTAQSRADVDAMHGCCSKSARPSSMRRRSIRNTAQAITPSSSPIRMG